MIESRKDSLPRGFAGKLAKSTNELQFMKPPYAAQQSTANQTGQMHVKKEAK